MFDWLGQSPATGVQWVDIILSFIAFGIAVVAIPTILQMFWGRPRVNVRLARHVEGDDRMLLVLFDNPPVRSRLMSRLGVRREAAQSLEVTFRISEVGSGTILDPVRHARIYGTDNPAEDDAGKERVTLPPTYSVAASFLVACWDRQQSRVFVPPDRLRQQLVLEAGYYQIDIAVVVDGQSMLMQWRFIVGKGADDLRWAA